MILVLVVLNYFLILELFDFFFLGFVSCQMKALKALGLDVQKGTVTTEGLVIQTKIFITRM